MLTEKDYCDYETCVALKELGYNGTAGECSHFGAFHMNGKEIFYDRLYNSELKENECLRVPLYLAQKFLREEKGIFVYIDVPWKTDDGLGWSYFCCNKPMTEEDKEVCFASGGFYDSYEEALIEGIKASVKILKEKLNEKDI